MSTDRRSIPVSLPEGLVEELDELVEAGKFGSRSEALRYGARLVTREAHQKRIHERTTDAAEQDIDDRLERKRVR